MTIEELKRIVDMLHETHGPNTRVDFLYQFASQKTRIGPMTGYDVFCGTTIIDASVRIKINYPRGSVVE